MSYLLLVLSIACNVAFTLMRSALSRKYARSPLDYQVFNLFFSVVTFLFFLIALLITGSPLPSLFTLAAGVAFGVAKTLMMIYNMRALACGPVSYTTLILTSGMIVPALSGWLFYGEDISWVKGAGIVLMMISITLSVCGRSEQSTRKITFKWLVFAAFAALCSGAVGMLQKFHQTSEHSSELLAFLCIAFLTSSCFSGLLIPFYTRKGQMKCDFLHRPNKQIVTFSVLTGVGIAASGMINLYLSGAMESIIFYPSFNGGSLFVLTLFSVIIMREKLNAFRWTGLAIGFVSVALLCL